MTQDEERRVVSSGLPHQKRQNFTAAGNRVGKDIMQTLLMKPRLYFYRRREEQAGSLA
jgi:hypothetical protein